MNLAPLPVATSGVWPGPLCSVTPRAKGGDRDTDTLPWRECTWVKKQGTAHSHQHVNRGVGVISECKRKGIRSLRAADKT